MSVRLLIFYTACVSNFLLFMSGVINLVYLQSSVFFGSHLKVLVFESVVDDPRRFFVDSFDLLCVFV
jgi:hypothetical protein